MRQWRVGSFSMGLVLVLLGVALLLELLKGYPAAFELAYTWWPAILIVLGLEVLVAGFFNRGEQVRIRYDFLSMLLVLIFFCFSLAAYSLQVSGVFGWLRENIVSRSYTTPVPLEEISLDGIKKIVLTSTAGNLEIRSTTGDTLSVFGQATLFAPTAEEAAELADSGKVQSHRAGDTLFVNIPRLATRESFGPYRSQTLHHTVLIPAGVALEARNDRYSGEVTVVLEHLAAAWSVQTDGSVRVSLDPGLDTTVKGTVEYGEAGFKGNAAWEIIDSEQPGLPAARGRVLLGKGTWPLEITARNGITLNVLP